MVPPTKTTPKPFKIHDNSNNNIHPLTPTQTHEPPSSLSPSASVPLRRRSLRLASVSNSEPAQCPTTTTTTHDSTVRVSSAKDKKELNGLECEGNERGKGFLNLRSGKKVLKRGMTVNHSRNGRKRKKQEEEEEGKDDSPVMNVTSKVDEGGSSVGESGRKLLSREEKGKAVMVDVHSTNNVEFRDLEKSRNSNTSEHGSRRNEYMERFRDIARENASRFAHFAPEENENENEMENDESSSSEEEH